MTYHRDCFDCVSNLPIACSDCLRAHSNALISWDQQQNTVSAGLQSRGGLFLKSSPSDDEGHIRIEFWDVVVAIFAISAQTPLLGKFHGIFVALINRGALSSPEADSARAAKAAGILSVCSADGYAEADHFWCDSAVPSLHRSPPSVRPLSHHGIPPNHSRLH